jgi:N-acetyl-gamma-glutamyl-phosphate reductase
MQVMHSLPVRVYTHAMPVLTSPSTAVATAGVVGSTGYAGRELLRLLAGHPQIDGTASTADMRASAGCDLVFLALPHGAASELGRELAGARVPVVDLSADQRGVWTYGLPELHRVAIAESGAIANPGCYATAAILALAPLVEAGLIEPHVVVDGKSGVSGAGKSPTDKNVFCAAAEGIGSYAPVGHHHQLEIERELSSVAGAPITVTFTPHLAPFSRGLLVTAYGRLTGPLTQDEADDLYLSRYGAERFVHMLDQVRTQPLRGSNSCHVKAWVDPDRGAIVVASAIDNLVKGAAGQAIQNANLILGLDETTGLPSEGLWP